VINVEKAEHAAEQFLRRRQTGEIFIEAVNVRLHNEHADHAGAGEQDEQRDAEAHGTQEVEQPRDNRGGGSDCGGDPVYTYLVFGFFYGSHLFMNVSNRTVGKLL
jgi:hypothetical protein